MGFLVMSLSVLLSGNSPNEIALNPIFFTIAITVAPWKLVIKNEIFPQHYSATFRQPKSVLTVTEILIFHDIFSKF